MRFAYLFITLALVGCASSAEEVAASESNLDTGNTTPAADAILVQQAERVFSRKIGKDGAEIETKVDEVALMVGAKVLVEKHDRASGTYECSAFGLTPMQGAFESDQLSLAEANGASTILVPAAEKSASDFQLVQSSEIRGHLGPYVFVRQSASFMGCGAAHGNFGRTSFVWDAKNQRKIDFEPPSAALERAIQELSGRGFEEEPHLAEVIPQFDASGKFSLGWRFEKLASYAESDGLGSAYTVSTIIDSKTLDAPLPPELDARKEPPASVAAFLEAHPAEGTIHPIVGWSRAD